MSYTPTNWQTGDTVTAEKLNKMEQGIQTAVDPFIVTFTPTAQDFSGITDKSNTEIYEAFLAGKQIIARIINNETKFFDTPAYVTVFNDNGVFTARVETFGLQDNLFVLFQQTFSGEPQPPYLTTIYPLTPMS